MQNNNLLNTNSKINKTVSSRIEIDAESEGLNKTDNKEVFITQNKQANFFDNKEYYTFHDLIVPGGKNAKLVSLFRLIYSAS
jgi:hypothetical protein